ncbi:MAG: type IV pilin-like G/H family protein [Stenomitos frigidus ULC029]
MKTLLTNTCAQLAIAMTLVACNPSRPPVTSSPLPNALPASPIIGSPSPQPTAIVDPFAKGVDKAASASQLAQSAQTTDDWRLVLSQWQRAIAFMQAVPASDPNHAAAQKLLVPYRQALARTRQLAKSGGASESATVVQSNADGGIPLIAGGQPSASPSTTKGVSTTAVATVKVLLQQQTDFFAKQKRFATTLTELETSLPAETPSYTYSTSVSQLKQAIVTAAAKQEGLPSYTGTLLSVKNEQNNDTTLTAICVTSKPAKVPPDAPQSSGQEIQCPSGASKL